MSQNDSILAASHTLELNLILVFIYVASSHYRPASAILYAASSSRVPYLTFWSKVNLILPESSYRLRPINVPSKPKWLRDTIKLLGLQASQGSPDRYMAIVIVDLGL